MKRKNKAAVALGRLGGQKGGPSRMAALTPAQRSQLARRGAAGRWFPKMSEDEKKKVRGELMTLGAPLYGTYLPVDNVEAALVHGVVLSHLSGTVASVLPVCFYRAKKLDRERLRAEAERARETAAVGFFLELTDAVAGTKRFRSWLDDYERPRRQRGFFPEPTMLSRKLAERDTSSIAASWGWRMNASFDTFKSTFEKHTVGRWTP